MPTIFRRLETQSAEPSMALYRPLDDGKGVSYSRKLKKTAGFVQNFFIFKTVIPVHKLGDTVA